MSRFVRCRAASLALLLGLLLSLPAHPIQPARAQAEVCYGETGFCLEPGVVADFFDLHGGPYVLGFPISRPFVFRGQPTQLFQRAALALAPDGSVVCLDLPELLPLGRLAQAVPPGSIAEPAPDPPSSSGWDAFLRSTVPDDLDGRPIGFRTLFLSASATAAERASGALAVWGKPTSPPRVDPRDETVVYQWFERAIFRQQAGGRAEALLLGDQLKALLRGQPQPAELSAPDEVSPLRQQYNPAAVDGLHRPWDIASTNLAQAFAPPGEPAPRPLLPRGFSPESGWPSESSNDVEIERREAEYVIGVAQAGRPERGETALVSNLVPLRDLALVVDLRLDEAGPAGYALHLRRRSDRDRLTLLVDAAREYAALYERQDGKTRALWDWSPAPALRPATEVNRWTVRLVDRRMNVWVNGTPLIDLEVSQVEEGSFWVGPVTWGGPNRLALLDLTVTAP